MVGGAAGKSVRKADLLITVETTEAALEAAELFFQYYREHGNYLERTYDFVERLGIDKVRKETVYAPDAVRQGLLDRLRKSKALRAATRGWRGRRPCIPRSSFRFSPIEEVHGMSDTSSWIRVTRGARTFRRVKGGRRSSAVARSRSSTSAIASSRSTTAARTKAVRCATASSPATRSCARCTPGK